MARLLREAEQTAVSLIRSHQAELGQLVALLLEQETVDGDEVYRIVGMTPPEHRQDAAIIAPARPAAAASRIPNPALPGGHAAASPDGPAPAKEQG